MGFVVHRDGQRRQGRLQQRPIALLQPAAARGNQQDVGHFVAPQGRHNRCVCDEGVAQGVRFWGSFVGEDPGHKILVSVNMLDTGFDAPEVVNLVMARFTRSVVLYRQMRGRGTRKAPGKSLFTLFDFVGVTDYHDDDEATATGGVIAQPKPATKHETRNLLTLDIDDHIDPTTREWVTIDDNGNFVFVDQDEQRAMLLGARFEAWLNAQPGLHADMRRLLVSVREYIKANANTCDVFTVDHFVVPPFSNLGGLQRAVQMFGGETPLADTLQSLNRAVFIDSDANEAPTLRAD